MDGKEIVTRLTLDNANFKKGLSDSEKQILKFSAVVAGIATTMTAAAAYTAQWQDATIKASRSAGVQVEKFSALSVAAEKSNVSQEELTKSLSKLNNITPEMAKNLASVGVSATGTNGKFKDTASLLTDVAEQMSKYKNPANQAMVATRVFGEEGGKLVSLLKDGKAGLEAARQEAEKYGLVVSESAGKAAEKFNDDLTDTKNALKGLTSSISESIIAWTNQGGIMNNVRDAIAGVTQWWRGLSSETKNTIVTIGAVLTGFAALTAAIIAINAILPTLKSGLATAFGPVGLAIAGVTAAIVGFVKFISDYGDTAKAIFSPLAQAAETAWNALKSIGSSIAKIFEAPDDQALQKSLERTGKNMQETQKSASVFARVMAGLSAGVSVTFQTISGLVAMIANGINQAIEQVKNFNALMTFIQKGNFDGAKLAYKNMQVTMIQAAKANENLLFKVADGIDSTIRAAGDIKPVKLKFDTGDAKKNMEDVKKFTEKTTTALGFDVSQSMVQTIDGVNNGVTKFKNNWLTVADFVKKAVSEITGYIGGISSAMKAVTDVMSNSTKYNAQVAQRDLEVQSIRSKKAYEEMRANAEAEENAKTAALSKEYDDQLEALKNAEAAKTAAIEFQSKQRLLINDQEYQTAKQQAEEAHAKFMEAERQRFEEEKALMDEKTYDKEQRRLNEGVMDAKWAEYVKAQDKALQDQLAQLAKDSADKKTKIESDAKLKIQGITDTNAAKIKLLEAAKAEALQKQEEEKNKRLADIDAARTQQEKDEEKKRLQIQYDAEVQDFEQTKAVKITDVMVAGITAAANAFAALAPIPFVGWGLGMAAAAAITGATVASIAQINSQRPVKPAGLIAETGGLVDGPRHSQGGVDLNAEGGELILSRGRTRALFDAMDSGALGGGITVNIEAGAIQAMGFDDRNLAEKIGDMVAQKVGLEVRRLGIVGA